MFTSLCLLSAALVFPLLDLVSSADVSSGNTGTFQNPASRDRPRFRYWLPDASVDPQTLKDDIKAVGSIGAGGVEFVPFYNYGGELGGPPPGTDWAKYGFGTPAFIEVLRAALEAHHENGLAMDFAFGPSEGQGVPSFPDNEGLQWELVTHTSHVPRDGIYNETLPGWGAGDLVAAVSAYVVSSENITISTNGYQGQVNTTYEDMLLRNATLKDMTDRVSPSTGQLAVRFPRPCGTGHLRIFAFYQRLTGAKNLHFDHNATSTIWDHGSYTVDHFSSRGARVTTDFWDEYILSDPLIKQQLREVGNFGWEDSLELKSTMSWSPTLPGRFLDKFGYDMRKYLPLFVFGNNNINLQTDAPGVLRARLDTDDAGVGFVNDYRAALADGYIEYLQTLRSWLHDTLDVQLSVQPSYNMPMDMLFIVPFVDAPESESLQGQNNVDGYRSFSGPTNLAGNKIISNELGAVFNRAYSFTISELLHMANRCFSGGVNQVVIHGQSYTGDYPGTTWPGHVPFRYYASDLYNTKRPDWDHGLGQALDYLGRVQHVQRQGVARTDVAVYQKLSVTDPNFNTVYQDDDLVSNGWSYNYLTAENLDLEQAVVDGGVLTPGGPSYRALVVPAPFNLSLSVVKHLEEYASSGLPVIFSGGKPGYYPRGSSTDETAVLDGIEALLAKENVHTVEAGGASVLLYSLGLRPRVEVRTEGLWYTTWREDASNGVDYAYVFCDTADASGELAVDSTKRAYILDPWTGVQTRLLHYRVEDGRTVIPLTLAGNESLILSFSDQVLTEESSQEHWFHSVPDGVLHVGQDAGGLFVDVPAGVAGDAVLSNGEEVHLESAAAAPWNLSDWTLTAEHWEAPEDMWQASVIAEKRNTTLQLESLESWLDIPSLANVSGIGYYTANFELTQPLNGTFGAYIRFPPVLNAISASVNGRQLPPLNYAAPMADITEYLASGTNEITVTVPSTMWNYIRTLMDEVENGGLAPIIGLAGPLPPPTDNGLVGHVSIIPAERVHVKEPSGQE